MPDYIGQGDQDISPQTKNPPKVPRTGVAIPGTREARVQVGGKGFPQVHKDKGVKVVDPGDAESSSEEEEEEEEEEERSPTMMKPNRRRSGIHCPAFSTESYLQRQEQQKEERERQEEEERAGTYYQYNPRYDEGYTGGLTGSAVPPWMSAEPDILTPKSWRSISSISDYDDDSDESSGSPAKKLRSSPPASPKRPRPSDEDEAEGDRSIKRLRTEPSASYIGEEQQGLGVRVVGIANQQTDEVDLQSPEIRNWEEQTRWTASSSGQPGFKVLGE
ncbi:hypothetical protein N0V85_004030 [Neurospora sp. IMI 360204]|nr:hypothetical protein N0V85_004030 [Neurospora sp. IMI 360204]